MHFRDSKTAAWLRSLPHAHPCRPDTIGDWLKFVLWKIITPFQPHVRDLLVYLEILRHHGRDNYLLGRLAPHHTVETFVAVLLEKGFGNCKVAWDEGQLVSLRYAPDFKYQYHVRIFPDGEVRGHYEYTPEYRPFLHLKEVGMEPRYEYFLEIIGDHMIPA